MYSPHARGQIPWWRLGRSAVEHRVFFLFKTAVGPPGTAKKAKSTQPLQAKFSMQYTTTLTFLLSSSLFFSLCPAAYSASWFLAGFLAHPLVCLFTWQCICTYYAFPRELVVFNWSQESLDAGAIVGFLEKVEHVGRSTGR